MTPRGGKKIVIVRKKVVSGGGHHGGSWKVAYADFVTAMMAFFMVMWILGMDDHTKQAIEGYFANPVGYKKGYGSGSSPVSVGSSPNSLQRTPLRMVVRSAEQRSFEKVREQILTKIADSDSLKGLKALVDIKVTNDGLRIELVESGKGDDYFPLGSSRMKPTMVLALQLIAEELRTIQHPIIMEGHTDAAKFSAAGGSYGNWELSSDRANAARRVLESGGVSRNRISEVRGYAETQPRLAEDPMSPANRRISIMLPFSRAPDGVGDAESLAAAKRDSLIAKMSPQM